MDVSRRDFIGLTTAAIASSGAPPAARAAGGVDDPLDCRDDFPAAVREVYLNSPYIAPSPQPVVDAVVDFHRAKGTDPISLGAMLEETQTLRQRFAALVNANTAEVGLLSTTSEGENIVTAALELGPGANVVIDDLHYNTTVLLYDHLAKQNGIEVRVVKNDAGASTVEQFAEQVDAATRLVSVSWVSHQNGYRHDLAKLARLAHQHDAYLYVDAIQGVGAVPLDVRETEVDFFTAGSYKWLLGGFGIAPFYVRESLLDEIAMDRIGWRQLESEPSPGDYRFYTDARKYGYATPAFGAVYQLSAGIAYLSKIGVERIADHTIGLANALNRELRELGFRVQTPADNPSAIVAFEHGRTPEEVAERFASANIKVSLREGGAQVRAGIALFNNRADIDALLDVASTLRG